MSRFLRVSVLFVFLLAACGRGDIGAECQDGVCLTLEVQQPVQASKPALFTITVTSKKDISDLHISLSSENAGRFVNSDPLQEGVRLVYDEENMKGWSIDARSEETYIITGQVILDQPVGPEGEYSYRILAAASLPTGERFFSSVPILLDGKGNQIEQKDSILSGNTNFPAPTAPPDLTPFVPTPMETVAWPTSTATPPLNPTATISGYPFP